MIPPLCMSPQGLLGRGSEMGIPEEKVVCLEGQRQVAAIALWAPCSGIEIQEGKQTKTRGRPGLSRAPTRTPQFPKSYWEVFVVFLYLYPGPKGHGSGGFYTYKPFS